MNDFLQLLPQIQHLKAKAKATTIGFASKVEGVLR